MITQAQSALTVTIAGSSTSAQLDLVITGTVENLKFGGDGNSEDLYLYAPGVEWATGSLANSTTSVVEGTMHTAPSLAGTTYFLGGASINGEVENVVLIRDLPVDIETGDVFDVTFSVRNFGIANYNFTPLLNQGSTLDYQVGSGTLVPEPTSALMLVSSGLAFLLRRSR